MFGFKYNCIVMSLYKDFNTILFRFNEQYKTSVFYECCIFTNDNAPIDPFTFGNH